MKNIKKKIAAKVSKKPKTSQLATITNNTLEEERKAILDNGRKFKYPVQYSKNKLVINTLIISGVVLLLSGIFVWFQLYKAQNTGDIIYRITTVLPLNVAKIDGQGVRYSDYLMDYRANLSISEKKKGALETGKDEEAQKKSFKNRAMENAIRNSYAIKIARENGISVSNEEIETYARNLRTIKGKEQSEEAFRKITEDNYGLSQAEFRRMFIELPLLRDKVVAHIDENAKKTKNEVFEFLKGNGNDFAKLREKFPNLEIGAPGKVQLSNIDGGRTNEASKLNAGQISEPFVSNAGDGYYIVKLISKDEKELSYEYVKIKFTEFDNRLEKMKTEGKIQKFIEIEERK